MEIVDRQLRITVEDVRINISLCSDSDLMPTTSPDVCLIIYGGSRDFSQEKLRGIKNLLAVNGFVAASFDFRGMGEDSENFANTGLHTRIKDTRAVFRQILFAYPTSRFFILGVSMGGYIATFLNPRDIAGLVLVAPAAYDAAAVQKKINFGHDFSSLIRAENSYLKSDAFARMEKFRLVRTAIISFEEDEVVPAAVTDRYFASHPGSPDRKRLKILPGKHNGNFSNPERMNEIVKTMAQF